MPIQPFHFRLKKVSGSEERLINALYEYLPATGLRSEFERGIKEAAKRHLGENFTFGLSSLEHESFSSYLAKVGKPAVLVLVGLTPRKGKAILEIDPMLAMSAIEKILGGSIQSVPEPRALTDTEQGVLQYVILQIIAHVHRLCKQDPRVHFRFESFAFMPHEVRNIAGGDDKVAVLSFDVNLGPRAGYVRLVLPDPFIEEGFLNVPDARIRSREERAWYLDQIARFSYVKVPLQVEVGRATLAVRDLKGIEAGDVILFDSSGSVLSGGKPSGFAVLKVGHGLCGGIDSKITVHGRRVRCKITGMHKGE